MYGPLKHAVEEFTFKNNFPKLPITLPDKVLVQEKVLDVSLFNVIG